MRGRPFTVDSYLNLDAFRLHKGFNSSSIELCLLQVHIGGTSSFSECKQACNMFNGLRLLPDALGSL